MAALEVCHIMPVFQCSLYRASMTKLAHRMDFTLKFLYKSQNHHTVWFGEQRTPEVQVWTRHWMLGWCLIQQALMINFFQIQQFGFIQALLHQCGPAEFYGRSLTGCTWRVWGRSGSQAMQEARLGQLELGKNSSLGFLKYLPVMLSHLPECGSLWHNFLLSSSSISTSLCCEAFRV